MTSNAERLEAHKARLRKAGFKRLNIWVCQELAQLLADAREPQECCGRTLERLLLGQAKQRPQN
ncbi:hypothetical protein [Cupriavidus oxalaticus]|uniref:hypothetical protein n=1 Tax=Cupriavidus oxalaticus TaxID=96344 RepID=UPI0031758BF1